MSYAVPLPPRLLLQAGPFMGLIVASPFPTGPRLITQEEFEQRAELADWDARFAAAHPGYVENPPA